MKPRLLITIGKHLFKHKLKPACYFKMNSKAIQSTQGMKEPMEPLHFADLLMFLSLVYILSHPILKNYKFTLKINISNINTNCRRTNGIL